MYQQYQFANLLKQLLLLLTPFQPWNYYQIKKLSLISCWRQVVYTFVVKCFTHNLKYWLILITESHFLSWTRSNKGEVNKEALTHLHDLLLAFLVLKWWCKTVIWENKSSAESVTKQLNVFTHNLERNMVLKIIQ